jgi:YidC/Oxa1 family membrane protein insertase
MQQPETRGMWGRYVLFMVLAVGILVLNSFINPPRKPLVQNKPPAQQAEKENPTPEGEASSSEGEKGTPESVAAGAAAKEPGAGEVGGKAASAGQPESSGPGDTEKEKAAGAEAPETAIPARVAPPPKLITLGSADPASPYRELVTLTNLGAAVVRDELNSPRFRDLEDRSGYLGQGVLDEIGYLAPDKMVDRIKRPGCPVWSRGT